jgi:CDP-glucose 4,6-dehydratase
MEDLVDQLRSAYSGKRVLITGHNGFKGSWLVALLAYLGAETHGISLEISHDSPFKNFHKQNLGSSYIIDIRNFALLKAQIESINPEIVFHLAAQSLVLDSYVKPRETFEVNVQGTVNLLDSLTNTDCLGVIATTTDKVYKNDDTGVMFKESDELWGHDPYSLSKTGVELAVEAWRNLPKGKKCTFVTVRAGNVFGPGDRARHRLLPDLLHSIQSNLVAEIRSPESVRPWQYVLDPLFGYLLLGSKILDNHEVQNAYNFGPAEDSFVSVLEFVNKLKDIADFEFTIVKPKLNLESKILKLDSSLAQNRLGWKGTTSLTSGLKYSLALDHPQIGMKRCLKHVEEYLFSAQNSLVERFHNL